jgi:hypothetical protein
MTSTYQHPADPNLNNLMKSMEYAINGDPSVRTMVMNDITQPIPVSLNGNDVVITGNVTIPGVVNVASSAENPVHVHVDEVGTSGILTVPWLPIAGNVYIDGGNVNVRVSSGNMNIVNTPTIALGGVNVDAFGRLRVSEPFTLFESALSGQRRYDYSNSVANGGTVSFDYNANVRYLTVTTTNGSEAIRESLYVFPYQPGKSLLVMNTFCFAPPQANLRQRVGYFGASNGIYFQNLSGVSSFVKRSSSSGVLVEQVVPQTSWNADTLNGSGPSGVNLQVSSSQIFWEDFEWLGVGSVRCGFVINGQFILAHTFNHANNAGNTSTYMGSATLPIRFEITNTGATAVNSNLTQICSTVISEGGSNPTLTTYSAGTGISTVRLATAGTYYPIVSLRLNSNYLNSVVYLSQVDILSPTVNYYRWAILKNATLTGANWTAPTGSTRVDADTAATAASDGIEIQSGFASSRDTILLANNIADQLGRSIAGVSETWTLVLTATSNNADVLAQLGWQQIQ